MHPNLKHLLPWLLAGFCLNTLVIAQKTNCWAADHYQAPDPAVAKSAPVDLWKQDLDLAGEILKKIPTLQVIPDTRMRLNKYLGYRPMPGFGHTARVSAGLYPPRAWEGECGLNKHAERINRGHLHITFNEPRDIFGYMSHAVKDSALTAYIEPEIAESIDAETIYRHRAVILTPGHISPWIAVSVDEFLQYKLREAEADLAEIQQTLEEMLHPEDPGDESEAMLRELEKTDPAQAQELRKIIAETRRQTEAGIAAALPEIQRQVAEKRRQRDDLIAYREALPAGERSAPAYLEAAIGQGRYGLATERSKSRGKLVKINPALCEGENARRRIQLIVVQPFANDDTLWDTLTRALRETDFPALRRLLR